jgi:hypothetical protein
MSEGEIRSQHACAAGLLLQSRCMEVSVHFTNARQVLLQAHICGIECWLAQLADLIWHVWHLSWHVWHLSCWKLRLLLQAGCALTVIQPGCALMLITEKGGSARRQMK